MPDDVDLTRLARDIDELVPVQGKPMTPQNELSQRIEARLASLGKTIRGKANKVAKSARDVITAPDEEPTPRPNSAVLARMIAWFNAPDDEPKDDED